MVEEAPDVLRDRADEILRRSEFADSERGLLSRAMDWVGDRISDLFSSLGFGTSFGGVAVGLVILVVFVGLIVFFLLRYMPRLQPARLDGAVESVSIRNDGRSRKEWLATAAAAEGQGDFRAAVEARYRATVAGLIEREELSDSLGATANDLRSQFDAEPARTDPFSAATDVFSDMQYGGFEVGSKDSVDLEKMDSQVMVKRTAAKPIHEPDS